jgi:hypothetical protein
MSKNDTWKMNAQNAVQYVRSKLQIGASNKGLAGGAYVGSMTIAAAASSKAAIAVQSAFQKVDPRVACVSAQRSAQGFRFRQGIDYQWIKAIAAGAATSGCGNCGEQAALAFDYLLQRHIRPLDYMYRTDGDHAFVLIGRDRRTDVTRPQTWSSDVVVCDPWRGEVVDASTIVRRGWGVDSAFHMD